MNTTAVAPRAGRREWIGLAVLALPCLLYSMDLTVLNLAVPAISADLRPSGTELLWIVDIYGFLLAGSLITMGTLGDRIGRRRLLLAGAAAFGTVSVLAAYATSAGQLIAARALLGVAGATLAPSTLALLRTMFVRPAQRTMAISVWATSFSVGAGVGPLLGGLLLERFWWGSAFLVAVPVMAMLLVLGPTLLPEYRDPRPGRLDLGSVGMSLAAVLAVIYGLKRLAQDGFQDGGAWLPVPLILGGLAVGLVFVRRQRALADPLVDLRLFRVPAFSVSLVTYTLGIFAGFGVYLFTAQYLQLVLGLSPLWAGLWTLPEAGGFIVGSMLAPLLVRRVRPGFVMGAGMGLVAIGIGLLTQLDGASGLALLVAASVVSSLGLAPVVTVATDLIVGAAPPERAGAASGMSETGAEFGGALGIAILGSIGTAVYRAQMVGAVPAGLPAEAATAARDTLGGAVVGAGQLPGQLGAALLDAARQAFTQGLHLAAILSAAVALAIAIVAAVLLRRVRTNAEAGARLPDPAVAPAEPPAAA
jgi:DHA2 family multidrug resistance protein-like MFS transporter